MVGWPYGPMDKVDGGVICTRAVRRDATLQFN